MHPSLQLSRGAMLLCLNFSASGLWILVFFSWMLPIWSSSWPAVRQCFLKTPPCGWKIWQDASISTWQPQTQSPHSAATPMVCKILQLSPALKATCSFISNPCSSHSRLPIPPCGKGAQGCHQGPDRTLHWCSARFAWSLYLHNAQGAGQTDGYGLSAGHTLVLIDCCLLCEFSSRILWPLPSESERWPYLLTNQSNRAKSLDTSVEELIRPQHYALFPGEPLHGYRVCIQAILQHLPKIATQNLPSVSYGEHKKKLLTGFLTFFFFFFFFLKHFLCSSKQFIRFSAAAMTRMLSFHMSQYLELLRSVQNRPVKCLTIMWTLGQAGFYDLGQGLRGNRASRQTNTKNTFTCWEVALKMWPLQIVLSCRTTYIYCSGHSCTQVCTGDTQGPSE